ncbi:MAG: hypothetical protein SF182_22185 [Deltaproteobacteria bacterium]|nr:hypothetical protein [Deltaproteobacteria bacterium]
MLWFGGALIGASALGVAWCGVAALRGTRAWADVLALLGFAGLLAAGVLLRGVLIAPRHAMYLDEPWYAEAACNASRGGRLELCSETWAGRRCEPYEKGIGWPLLLVPAARWTDCDPSIGIAMNRGLGAATIGLVLLATRLAGGRWWQGLFAATLLAAHPLHALWSATGESNVSAAAALLAGVCGALWYLRSASLGGALLAAAGFGLACAIRPENGLAALTAAAVLAWFAPNGRLVALAVMLIAGAASATGLPLWRMNEQISGGAFLSPRNWPHSASLLIANRGLLVHAPIALLALVGAGRVARRVPAVVALLVAVGVGAALVVLAYDRFHPRMLLPATVALLPLAALTFACSGKKPRMTRISPKDSFREIRVIRGLTPRVHDGLCAVGALIVAVAILSVWRPLLLDAAGPPVETQELEMRLTTQVRGLPLPDNALIIAAQPTVLAAGGMKAVMSTAEALRDPAALRAAVEGGRPVFFLRDMYCELDYQGGAADCRAILDGFAVESRFSVSRNVRRYELLRLVPG